MRPIITALAILYAFSLSAQATLLQSGPMLGYNEMMEVLLWVQTKEAARVQFAYWETDKPRERLFTEAVVTEKDQAFTAKLPADRVQPGRSYDYELLINDKPVRLDYPTTFRTQPIWRWRTDPPDFTMAVGSCAYVNEPEYDRPGEPYGSNYQIFTSIHRMRPDAMLWLGDNIYLREVDWYSRTGILHRNTHTRSLPELQPLLASTHHYAIWDDHDFGPNNADRSFVHKDKALEAFKLFWGNPGFGIEGRPGITTFFQYHDIDFFLLDDRYYRSPNDRRSGEPTILGEEQLEWLIDALSFSQAPFKMVAVGGQVLNTAPVDETYANRHWKERDYLLRRIEEEGIKGVIFLTGDRHHTELSHYVNAAGNDVYDLTVSPLTSGPGNKPGESNRLRVDGTYVGGKHNFGLLRFSGPRLERRLGIRIFDANGEELWSKEIAAPAR